MFDHPLRIDELKNFCGDNDLDAILSELVSNGKCFEHDQYFAVKKNIVELVEIRMTKELKAKKYFKKLPFYARLIKSFPFVKGIAISGSLSKNVMHSDGDIDYFIVTTKGRLWVARTFLVAFKKIFLLNSKKYFCVNYFVDEENLVIPDKNIYTAIEVTHLVPAYNVDLISSMKLKNDWTADFVNSFEHPIRVKQAKGKSWLGSFAEFLLKGKMGDKLDLRLMKFTYKKWEKKFKHFDASKFELTMRTNRGVSKHHPRDFQTKVLTKYQERLTQNKVEE